MIEKRLKEDTILGKKTIITGATVGVLAIGGIVGWNACTVKIPTGHVGLTYKLSGGINPEQTPLGQGLNFKSPFDKVSKYPVSLTTIYLSSDKREGSREDESFTAIGKDNNQMKVSVEMSYSFDQEKLPSTFVKFKGQTGEQIEDSFIRSKVKSWTAEALSQFDTFDVYGGSRTEANKVITTHLKEKFAEYGINVETANIIDIKLDEKTTQTINNKIQRQQEVEAERLEKEKQAIQNEKALEKAQAEAEKAKLIAQGEAEAELIRASAIAEANRLISESLTQELLEQQRLEAWNGEYPQVVSDASTILDLK